MPEAFATFPQIMRPSQSLRDRHHLHRGGKRQPNRALHIIAITRGRLDPATRAYLAREEADGKARMRLCAASNATSPAGATGFSVHITTT